VRDLRQTLGRAAARTDGERIELAHLRPPTPHPSRQALIEALDRYGGERPAAASLGLARSTFKRLMTRYGIPPRTAVRA